MQSGSASPSVFGSPSTSEPSQLLSMASQSSGAPGYTAALPSSQSPSRPVKPSPSWSSSTQSGLPSPSASSNWSTSEPSQLLSTRSQSSGAPG